MTIRPFGLVSHRGPGFDKLLNHEDANRSSVGCTPYGGND